MVSAVVLSPFPLFTTSLMLRYQMQLGVHSVRFFHVRLLAGLFLFFVTIVGHASPSQAQDNRPLVFHNNCNATVRLLVYHSEDPRRWQVNGFYTIRPNARSTLVVRGESITHITGHALYYYAELPNGRTFGTAERQVAHGGANYAMSRATITVEAGNNVFAVRC